jgi:hypothetical protein
MSSEQPSSDATDIFSLSDRVLAEKLQFVKEVHSCQPRSRTSADNYDAYNLLDWLW